MGKIRSLKNNIIKRQISQIRKSRIRKSQIRKSRKLKGGSNVAPNEVTAANVATNEKVTPEETLKQILRSYEAVLGGSACQAYNIPLKDCSFFDGDDKIKNFYDNIKYNLKIIGNTHKKLAEWNECLKPIKDIPEADISANKNDKLLIISDSHGAIIPDSNPYKMLTIPDNIVLCLVAKIGQYGWSTASDIESFTSMAYYDEEEYEKIFREKANLTNKMNYNFNESNTISPNRRYLFNNCFQSSSWYYPGQKMHNMKISYKLNDENFFRTFGLHFINPQSAEPVQLDLNTIKHGSHKNFQIGERYHYKADVKEIKLSDLCNNLSENFKDNKILLIVKCCRSLNKTKETMEMFSHDFYTQVINHNLIDNNIRKESKSAKDMESIYKKNINELFGEWRKEIIGNAKVDETANNAGEGILPTKKKYYESILKEIKVDIKDDIKDDVKDYLNLFKDLYDTLCILDYEDIDSKISITRLFGANKTGVERMNGFKQLNADVFKIGTALFDLNEAVSQIKTIDKIIELNRLLKQVVKCTKINNIRDPLIQLINYVNNNYEYIKTILTNELESNLKHIHDSGDFYYKVDNISQIEYIEEEEEEEEEEEKEKKIKILDSKEFTIKAIFDKGGIPVGWKQGGIIDIFDLTKFETNFNDLITKNLENHEIKSLIGYDENYPLYFHLTAPAAADPAAPAAAPAAPAAPAAELAAAPAADPAALNAKNKKFIYIKFQKSVLDKKELLEKDILKKGTIVTRETYNKLYVQLVSLNTKIKSLLKKLNNTKDEKDYDFTEDLEVYDLTKYNYYSRDRKQYYYQLLLNLKRLMIVSVENLCYPKVQSYKDLTKKELVYYNDSQFKLIESLNEQRKYQDRKLLCYEESKFYSDVLKDKSHLVSDFKLNPLISIFTIKLYYFIKQVELGNIDKHQASDMIISNLKTSSIGNFCIAANYFIEKSGYFHDIGKITSESEFNLDNIIKYCKELAIKRTNYLSILLGKMNIGAAKLKYKQIHATSYKKEKDSLIVLNDKLNAEFELFKLFNPESFNDTDITLESEINTEDYHINLEFDYLREIKKQYDELKADFDELDEDFDNLKVTLSKLVYKQIIIDLRKSALDIIQTGSLNFYVKLYKAHDNFLSNFNSILNKKMLQLLNIFNILQVNKTYETRKLQNDAVKINKKELIGGLANIDITFKKLTLELDYEKSMNDNLNNLLTHTTLEILEIVGYGWETFINEMEEVFPKIIYLGLSKSDSKYYENLTKKFPILTELNISHEEGNIDINHDKLTNISINLSEYDITEKIIITLNNNNLRILKLEDSITDNLKLNLTNTKINQLKILKCRLDGFTFAPAGDPAVVPVVAPAGDPADTLKHLELNEVDFVDLGIFNKFKLETLILKDISYAKTSQVNDFPDSLKRIEITNLNFEDDTPLIKISNLEDLEYLYIAKCDKIILTPQEIINFIKINRKTETTIIYDIKNDYEGAEVDAEVDAEVAENEVRVEIVLLGNSYNFKKELDNFKKELDKVGSNHNINITQYELYDEYTRRKPPLPPPPGGLPGPPGPPGG